MAKFDLLDDQGVVINHIIAHTQADADAFAPAGGSAVMTDDGIAEAEAAVMAAYVAAVDLEKDRRLRGTFEFMGMPFDSDQTSMQRITGAASLAGFAIGAGALPGNLFWHGGATPFSWISAENAIVTMDAQTTFAFGQAAAANETTHIFMAKALKEMNPIAEDVTDDQWWP